MYRRTEPQRSFKLTRQMSKEMTTSRSLFWPASVFRSMRWRCPPVKHCNTLYSTYRTELHPPSKPIPSPYSGSPCTAACHVAGERHFNRYCAVTKLVASSPLAMLHGDVVGPCHAGHGIETCFCEVGNTECYRNSEILCHVCYLWNQRQHF